MAITTNTAKTTVTDRTASGNQPDNTPATGTTTGGSGGSGVTKIISGGSNVSLSPTSGVGDVTISVTATSSGVSSIIGTNGITPSTVTTGAVSLGLAAITPTSVNGITLSGSSTPTLSVTGTSSISGSNTGDQTNITGTAGNITATSNSTLTTLSALTLPGSQVSGNIPGNAVNVTGTVGVGHGGTGLTATPTNGQLAIGNGSGYTLGTITGSGTVSVTNGSGTIAIAGSGLSNPMTTLGDTIYENSTPAPARLAGNTGTRRQYLSQTGTGSISAAPAWVNGPNYNVKDYGALGDGSTNDTTAIQAAINAAANASTSFLGNCVYFPSGTYCVTGLTIPSTNSSSASFKLVLKGDGPQASTITYHSSASTSAIFVKWNVSGDSNKPDAAVIDLGFYADGNRIANSPIFVSYGVTNLWLVNVYTFVQYDSFYIYGGNLIGNNLYVTTGGSGRTAMGCCLHAVCALVLSNCLFYSPNGSGTYAQGTPLVWMQTSNSSFISNCNIGGTGSLGNYTGCTVTGNGTSITITLPSGSTNYFNKNEFIILYGFTPSGYNGYWRISSISGLVITATCTVTGTVTTTGTVVTMPCGLLIDNNLGPVNESIISNCLFSNTSTGAPYSMTSAIYANGRATSTSNQVIQGWLVSNCYFDSGIVGIFLGGGGPNANDNTTFRWSISNCTFASNASNGLTNGKGMIWIEKTPGVQISNCQGTNANKSNNSVAVYAYSNGSVPYCDGLNITGCYLGVASDFYNNGNATTYGITLDGTLNIFSMSNCFVCGLTSPTQNINSALTSSSYVGGGGNIYLQGGSTGTLPTKVATPTYFP